MGWWGEGDAWRHGGAARGAGSAFFGEFEEELAGGADVGDGDFAGVVVGGGSGEAEFCAGEGDGFGGAEGDAAPPFTDGEAGVAVEAGGDIDAEDGAAGEVEGGDGVAGEAFEGAGEAGAEEGVDNEVAGAGLVEPGAELAAVGGERLQGEAHGLDDGELGGGGVAVRFGRGEEEDADGDGGVVEVACGDEAVGAVVAGAGEDEDGGVGLEAAEGGLGDGAAGVFHEGEDGEVEVLGGAAVEFAEGLAGEDEGGGGHEDSLAGREWRDESRREAAKRVCPRIMGRYNRWRKGKSVRL